MGLVVFLHLFRGDISAFSSVIAAADPDGRPTINGRLDSPYRGKPRYAVSGGFIYYKKILPNIFSIRQYLLGLIHL